MFERKRRRTSFIRLSNPVFEYHINMIVSIVTCWLHCFLCLGFRFGFSFSFSLFYNLCFSPVLKFALSVPANVLFCVCIESDMDHRTDAIETVLTIALFQDRQIYFCGRAQCLSTISNIPESFELCGIIGFEFANRFACFFVLLLSLST